MKHLTDEHLVLYFYGEAGRSDDIQAHLRGCQACAGNYERLSQTLSAITLPDTAQPDRQFWANVIERARAAAPERANLSIRDAAAAGLLVWTLALIYPFAPRAVFAAARLWQETIAGAPLFALGLAWAFAGPLAALYALDRTAAWRAYPVRRRFIVCGAVAATIAPALFNLTSRSSLGLPLWYGLHAALALAAFIPIPAPRIAAAPLRRFHRVSALLIVTFGAAHILNHSAALLNVATHTAVLDVLRVVYRSPIIETLLIGAILLQVATGGTLVSRLQLGRPSSAANVQALSGIYLAVFFLAHVSAALMARPDTNTDFVWAAGRSGLLASPRLTLLLPYYLLGVAAFFAHVGHYLRALALRSLPELSVRRLSYAGLALGAMVVVTIGLALCGVMLAA